MTLDQAKKDVEEARRKYLHALHVAKAAKKDYERAQARRVDVEFALATAQLVERTT
jgi:hypothetical protein